MVSAFKEKIAAALSGVINSDYIFLDTPYYTNIGDILIWQGTEDFLSALPYRCLYRCSVETYQKPEISEQAIIILNGGGNFGDLWRRHTEFLLRILRDFPRNKIVVFPQTVFYQNEAQLKKDAEQMAFHTNITICARDTASFTILQTYFNRHTILLVPDMAFCISGSRLDTLRRKQTNKTLFLRRGDKELNRGINYFDYIPEKDLDVRDWPSMEKRTAVSFLLMQLLRISRRIPVLFPKLTDVYASLFFKPVMIKTGVQFLSAYRKVYTTRLHAAILCCLLRKPCTFFDNSYGKNSSFFNTWLYDLDGIEFVPPPPPQLSGSLNRFEDTIRRLGMLILQTLSPLIDSDCVLMDLPYHANIGDILIWEGEMQLIKYIERTLLFTCNTSTYRHRALDKNTVILLHGGGNFGDIWSTHQEFRRKIIRDYPDNKIIILPQTVYYADDRALPADAELFNSHKKLTICARDLNSYKILQEHFSGNTVLIVPDMAFFIPFIQTAVKPRVSSRREVNQKKKNQPQGAEKYEICLFQ